jgi:hypothetical protein
MRLRHRRIPVAFALASLILEGSTMPQEPVPPATPDRIPDVLRPIAPADIRLEGWLGGRVANNARNRLLHVDEDVLLGGFRKRPGSHPWIGEHVGKFLHAATLAWANTGDAALRAKIHRVATELIKTQGQDGYLGTYVPAQRFGLFRNADWDVWSHKYCLIGLLTYHQYTGDTAALAAARKAGDLLITTFGAGKKSINSAGTHVGMAATSVLEPMVGLYRFTGDERYLEFAKYIVSAWDEPKGPQIMKSLLETKSVRRTANAKAYEMLSNLVGLCELARATGDASYLKPAVIAWEDVVANQLYLTGSASHGEHFGADHDLPNHPKANVGETCVTTTWIQLNLQLLRLTGEARYGDELERTIHNHLAAAQRPDGAQWCYYTALQGTKPYGPGTNCCVSSGPRGMALAPLAAFFTASEGGQDVLAINLLGPARGKARLAGRAVSFGLTSEFPQGDAAVLSFKTDAPATFALKVRSPAWAEPMKLRLEGAVIDGPKGGWALIPPRAWKDGDRVTLSFAVSPRLVAGEHTNRGLQAMLWGPLILAYDEKLNPGLPAPSGIAFAEEASAKPSCKPAGGMPLHFEVPVKAGAETKTVVFVPFAEAGATNGRYQVWLRDPKNASPANESLLASGRESRSRDGNINGSINDGDFDTFVVTFDGKSRDEDWFAVEVDAPVRFRRIVFAHGRSFHDGGWFDASAGKPRVQIRRAKGDAWETMGTIETYPATTAVDGRGLKDGQAFETRLKETVEAAGVRVAGRPACGDGPHQAFASCAEIQAFPE